MEEETVRIDGKRIRQLREARGWSQEHLASICGLSSRTVQRLEAEGKAAFESRMAVAAALEVAVEDLLDTGESITNPAPGTAAISPADRMKTGLWIASLVLVAVMFQLVVGLSLGKQAAERDNRVCQADPACHR
ncbi:MAG: helix-turn-helix domain-containing protein [Stenotrophomonas sp.]